MCLFACNVENFEGNPSIPTGCDSGKPDVEDSADDNV